MQAHTFTRRAFLVMGLVAPSSVYAAAMRAITPQAAIVVLDWFRSNVFTDLGRPYDHASYPHIGAPGGPCDALSDGRVRTIWLQWATRLGKTFFGQAAVLYAADRMPGHMMLASATEATATDVTDRLYEMYSKCPRLKRHLLPVHRRNAYEVRFQSSRCYVAWARSPSTLADKNIRVGLANEVDKWEHVGASSNKAKEADPLDLFADRFKNEPQHKQIIDSTPSIKGRSRIERGRLASTNCHLYVPCPHCGHYQMLRMGDGATPGGIVYEKSPNGRSDKDLARATAHYCCEKCEGKIEDHHRAKMMRSGVWCPEGCGVDSKKAAEAIALCNARGGDGASAADDYQWRGWSKCPWIVGTPVRDGVDAGYQLSSLYALTLGWGQIAAKFVESKDRPQSLRNFINQWLAETWEIVAHKTTWEKLGERLVEKELPRYVLPPSASLITVGVDRQSDRFVYVVDAWGPDRTSHTIDYGEFDSLDMEPKPNPQGVRGKQWFIDNVLSRQYTAEGESAGIKPAFTLIDSGYRPDGIYKFCRECRKLNLNVWPSKGSSTAISSDYTANILGKNTSDPGMRLYLVDTARTQGWLERQLHILERGQPGAGSMFTASLSEHQDFLEQLLNDAAVTKLDTSNNAREVWERVDDQVPNDYRDCRRYGYVAMLVATRGQAIRARNQPAQAIAAAPQPKITMPDGRPFFVMERR